MSTGNPVLDAALAEKARRAARAQPSGAWQPPQSAPVRIPPTVAIQNTDREAGTANTNVRTTGEALDNQGRAFNNTTPALRANLLGTENAPYELNPFNREAENRDRLQYQARTGIPRLHVDADPFRYLIPDRSAYAKAVAGAQNQFRAPNEKWQAAVKEQGDYTKMAQDVLDAINAGVQTGGITGQINGAIGGMYNPNVAAINAVESIASKANRVPGDIISNFDAKLLLRAAPGMSKPTEYNRAWAVNRIAAGKAMDDFNDYRDSWIAANGSTAGMVSTWKAYAEANPIFAKGKDGKPLIRNGNPVPNPNRASWQQWFKQRAEGALANETRAQTGGKPRSRNLVYDPKTGTLRNAD